MFKKKMLPETATREKCMPQYSVWKDAQGSLWETTLGNHFVSTFVKAWDTDRVNPLHWLAKRSWPMFYAFPRCVERERLWCLWCPVRNNFSKSSRNDVDVATVSISAHCVYSDKILVPKSTSFRHHFDMFSTNHFSVGGLSEAACVV